MKSLAAGSLATAFLTGVFTIPCVAHEPGERNEVEELRLEIKELKSLVAELTKKIDAMEYQGLPRLEDIRPEVTPNKPRMRFPSDRAPAKPAAPRTIWPFLSG